MDTLKLEQFFYDHWNAIVERCKKALEPDDLRQLEFFTSSDRVQAQVLDPPEDETRPTIPHEVTLLQPTLGHFNAFTKLFESQLGSKIDASFFWGIVGILLKEILQDAQALGKVPRMLKSIGYKAEAFNGYCAGEADIANQIKEACFDMQIQFIQFFTDTITLIRGELETVCNGQIHEQNDPWLALERQYMSVNKELTEILTRVETHVHMKVSHRLGIHSSELVSKEPSKEKFRCFVLPPTKTNRFFDKINIFEKIDQAMGQTGARTSFKSLALYGLGGVGKSAIASRYADVKIAENAYDAVFWVHGEKAVSMKQSFTDIALKLGLPGARLQAHDENLVLVQDWFQSTDCRWLVIYDNVESSDLLMPYWPLASHGHAIITTRNRSLAFDSASLGLEITSWDPKTGSEFLLFLLKSHISEDLETEGISALELSQRLSGHALGISHMAGLIQRRSWSISEFLGIYLKNPRRAHDSELGALWDLSFKSLPMDAATFLGIVSFLMPDMIPQALFDLKDECGLPKRFEFFSDEFSFSEAIESLLTLGLVKNNRNTRVFSIHRMVQTQFRYFQSSERRQNSFNDAVALVYRSFPKQGDTVAQLYDQWGQCDAYLQHVLYLADGFKEERKLSKDFRAPWEFCELLKECERYLCEINALEDLESLCEVSLEAVAMLDDEKRKVDLIASILSYQAIAHETLGRVETAIKVNIRAYEMRLMELPLKRGLLASLQNNLGYCCNTANQHQKSLECFEKCRDLGLKWSVSQGKEESWPTLMKANMARCLVYIGDYTGARQLLGVSISEFRNTTPLKWAMMAYAYFTLGTLDRREGKLEAAETHFIEAQNLWLKGDQTRLHPFNGGCMYKIGACCLDQGKVEAAVKHLRDSMEVTKFHQSSMPVEHARNLFKLSEALLQENQGDTSSEAEVFRDEADVLLRRGVQDAQDSGTEEAYDNFIPIFWR